MNPSRAPGKPSVGPLEQAVAAASEVLLGKERAVRLAVACILADGHLLIEDVPGVGKTTLAQVLGAVLGLSMRRIQFTSDLLPADIVGVSIYDRDTGAFRFNPGPVFAQLVLADEVNRATPKTQSALLEAMEERQVTQDGESRRLPEPFFVIATQNPTHQIGTFPLPESQLDRFLMRLELGYPDRAAERALLRGRDRRELLADLAPRVTVDALRALQQEVPGVGVSEALLDYVQAIIEHTRNAVGLREGLSPRGGLALLRAAKAWALLHGRDHVVPEDVQAVLPSVVGHRLHPIDEHGPRIDSASVARLIERVPIP
ncbi:MAG: MoxR family ATPase [Ectothiorhodospiraceae bacterium]|nr:MoxR family ATPase [Chromatiales bacterium]MCP5156328.1 MoxR family ATPase [Ectothiorhodospiraceae bacterium]